MKEISSVERHLFLEGIFLRYGYDFRQYSDAALDRRLNALLSEHQSSSLLEILDQVVHSETYFRSVLPKLTINTTEFFRDTSFFILLKERVFPVLATYPSIRIWVAGCSTGEESLSLAILLKEAGLYDRTTIYASDINQEVIAKAQKAIYPASVMKQFIKNYNTVSGIKSPSDYYTAEYDLAKFSPGLLKNIIFLEHNLATEGVFEEMHLILCRNVMIYFNKDLQNKVIHLLTKSLIHKGFLCLGSKETLRFSDQAKSYKAVDSKNNIYRFISHRANEKTRGEYV